MLVTVDATSAYVVAALVGAIVGAFLFGLTNRTDRLGSGVVGAVVGAACGLLAVYGNSQPAGGMIVMPSQLLSYLSLLRN